MNRTDIIRGLALAPEIGAWFLPDHLVEVALTDARLDWRSARILERRAREMREERRRG
jgi:hypothetical protein